MTALIEAARFYTKMDAKTGKYIICAVWIVLAVYSFPYYEIVIADIPLKNGRIRKLCSVKPNPNQDNSSWRLLKIVGIFIEFIIPCIFIVFVSLLNIFRKSSSSSSQNRIILLYTMTIATYWIVTQLPVRIGIIMYHFFVEVNFGFYIALNLISNCVIILNPIAYCYFDKIFFKQFCHVCKFNENEYDCEIITDDFVT